MKSLNQYFNDAKQYLTVWNRTGMAGTIRALYERNTILRNSDVTIEFVDVDGDPIDIGSEPRVSCQYFGGDMIGDFVCRITNSKFDIYLFTSYIPQFAKDSQFRPVVGGRMVIGDVTATKSGSTVRVKFNKLVKLPGIDTRGYVTFVIGPKTIQWADKYDRDASVTPGTGGAVAKRIAATYDIDPPKNAALWRTLYTSDSAYGCGILKEL